MTQTIQVGEIPISVTLKDVQNVHLSVHPPDGRVTLVAPVSTRLDVARAYVISKLGWIRDQQHQFLSQARETPRQFIDRETHYIWGRRYLLSVVYKDEKPNVTLDHKRITLTVRPSSDTIKRAEIFHEWHKSLLHDVVPTLLQKWQAKMEVEVMLL
ncbi:DUF45 domain-containing protein [Leptolyngbya sp. FACHB-17]|nr:YgjP-like metallopeptidase domain-containing protein [Leptolyngbya sp. FACHB-17]MBD2080605.1 DUF45 domain-containing protein [Leptolyngbya sp. FACHB-17]